MRREFQKYRGHAEKSGPAVPGKWFVKYFFVLKDSLLEKQVK